MTYLIIYCVIPTQLEDLEPKLLSTGVVLAIPPLHIYTTLMQQEKDAIKRNKPRHIQLGDKIEQFVKEVAEHYGITEPEAIRTIITRFYYGDFRKEAFGYMAAAGGIQTPRKQSGPKISDREEMVLRLNNMTNDEVTAWINSGDFMTKQEREKEDWICRTSPDTAEREIWGTAKNMEPGSKYERTVMDWPGFIAEVRKYYKNKAALEKVSS